MSAHTIPEVVRNQAGNAALAQPGRWAVHVRFVGGGFQLFTQNAFNIEDAISATKHEAALRFGCRQGDVLITRAELL